MGLDSAKSTSSTVSQAVKNRYYDKLFLRTSEAQLVHKQLGQINRKIESGEGGYGTGVVYWTRWSNLPLVSAGQGEGVPTTAVSMTATNVTGSTAQYDAAVSISDLLAYISFGDVMKAAMERLAYNAGLSIDSVVRDEVDTSGTFAHNSDSAIAAAAWTSIPSTAQFNLRAIRRAVRTLSRNNARKPDGGNWISVIHPDTAFDIYGDTSTGGWIDANKYTDQNANKLMNAEVGKMLGVRFLESSNAATRGTGVTASATIYITSIFGADAFGVTELQGLKTYVKGFSSGGTGDPTEKLSTAGWKTTFGASSLNSEFYVNVHHTVSTTA